SAFGFTPGFAAAIFDQYFASPYFSRAMELSVSLAATAYFASETAGDDASCVRDGVLTGGVALPPAGSRCVGSRRLVELSGSRPPIGGSDGSPFGLDVSLP